jgi:hypothetical protein
MDSRLIRCALICKGKRGGKFDEILAGMISNGTLHVQNPVLNCYKGQMNKV